MSKPVSLKMLVQTLLTFSKHLHYYLKEQQKCCDWCFSSLGIGKVLHSAARLWCIYNTHGHTLALGQCQGKCVTECGIN